MSRVSVIMPAYNVERYITEAIKSVLNQTYQNYEIIVVDDGSIDNTRQVLDEFLSSKGFQIEETNGRNTQYAIRNTRIRYFYQQNQGPAVARNRGVREANGEYIAFLDADDLWLPQKLEKQMNKFKKDSEYGLIHTNRIRIDLNGNPQLTKQRVIPEGQIFEELLKGNFICCSSVLVKKSCFDVVGLLDESKEVNKAEDYDMWLRIAYRYKCGFINLPLVKYRVNPNGHCRSNIKAAYDAQKAVFLKNLSYYEGDREKIKREIFYKMMYLMGHSFFYAKDYKNASLAFFKTLGCKRMNLRSILFCFLSKILEIINT
jgi:glycosyltransferase involved in cell wall biosynthesis